MPDFPDAKRVELQGSEGRDPIALSVHELGSGPAVVFCHGFPELAYSWRHQLPTIADAGFRAIAPDQRGYGRSDRPAKIEDYDLEHLCGDLAALLDALEIEKAIFVGHDWGGFVSWGMPVYYPERTAGSIGVCTPYVALPPTSVLRTLGGDDPDSMYIVWFQEPGVAEGVLDPQVRMFFDKFMRGGISPEAILERRSSGGSFDMNPFRAVADLDPIGELIITQEEIDVYVENFERTGFGPGMNWYRNIDRNVLRMPEIGAKKLELPCLMVTAEWDMALRPEMSAGMPDLCSDLEMAQVAKAGHWIQQEYPDELNAILVDWLTRRFL